MPPAHRPRQLDAEQEIQRVKIEKTDDVNAAAEDFADAVDEHQATDHIATNVHEEADRIRARRSA